MMICFKLYLDTYLADSYFSIYDHYSSSLGHSEMLVNL